MLSKENNFTNNNTFIPKRIAPLISSTKNPFSFIKVKENGSSPWPSKHPKPLPGLNYHHPPGGGQCFLANGASHLFKLEANEVETAHPHGEQASNGFGVDGQGVLTRCSEK